MNITKLLAVPVLVTLALFAGNTPPSGLRVHCDDGTPNSGTGCNAGRVTFSGTDYQNHVHVIVTMSNGTVVDDGFYQARGGVLSFTEVLSPADTYTITTSIHGGHDTIDDFTVATFNW